MPGGANGQNYHSSGNPDRDVRNKMAGTRNTSSKTDGKGGILGQTFSIVLDLRNDRIFKSTP